MYVYTSLVARLRQAHDQPLLCCYRYDGADMDRMLNPVVAGIPISSWFATESSADKSGWGKRHK